MISVYAKLVAVCLTYWGILGGYLFCWFSLSSDNTEIRSILLPSLSGCLGWGEIQELYRASLKSLKSRK